MTQLQAGNRALREGDFVGAVQCYLLALDEAPALQRFIGHNIAMARRGHRQQRAGRDRPIVAVCGADLARDAARVHALCLAHEPHAQVEVIGWLQPGAGRDVDKPLRGSTIPRHTLACDGGQFIAQALPLVAARPFDVLHLDGPSAANVILALLYKLLWGTRVFVDGVDTASPAKARQLPPVSALAGREWAASAAGLATHFDAVAGASPAAALRALLAPGGPAVRALTPEGMQWLGLLPLPDALRAVLPQLVADERDAALPLPVPLPPAPSRQAPSQPVAAPLPRAYRPLSAPAAQVTPPSTTWTRAGSLRPSTDAAVIELLGVAIGLLRHERLPDADLAILRAFADLQGRAADGPIRLRHRDGSVTHAAIQDTSAGGRCCGWRFDAGGVELVDLWFTTDSTLRLRLQRQAETTDTAPRVLRAFQISPGGGPLHLVAELPLAADGPTFADLPLAHPLFPLLLLVSTAEAHWLDARLLPFPSLCRGGLHHGELAAVGGLPDTMANLAALSNSLLAELAGWPEAAADLALAGIDVDLQGATGTEKLLSAPVKAWLAEVMQLDALRPLAIDETAPPSTRSFLAAACAVELPAGASDQARRRLQARGDRGVLTLALPADALPTVSVLASRRLRLPDSATVGSGTWVVAHPATGRACGVVSLPPMDHTLIDLQPRDWPLAMPLLRRREGRAAGSDTADARAPLPLAIRFGDTAKEPAARLLQPVAADRTGPLLRRALSDAERQTAAISVLLVHCGGDLGPLLQSVARQTMASAVEVVVLLPHKQLGGKPRVEALLQPLFPRRFRVLPTTTATPSASLNEAAALARGQHLLLLEPGTLLHDPRTLETLYTLVLAPGVASAACTVLREVAFKKGSEVREFAGGMFPRQLSFHGRPALVIDEPRTGTVFPQATYPVVGNSFRLALVAAAAWASLGGLDAENFPGPRSDLDFCLRALRAGLRHLCTGVVTATDLAPATLTEHVDTHALGFMPLARWHEVLAATSVIRDFET